MTILLNLTHTTHIGSCPREPAQTARDPSTADCVTLTRAGERYGVGAFSLGSVEKVLQKERSWYSGGVNQTTLTERNHDQEKE
jgi:hypothetical protein